MAEIKITKKKTIWPWILLILGILVLIYYVVMMNDDDIIDTRDTNQEMIIEDTRNEDPINDETVRLSETAEAKIRAFQAAIANDNDENMGLDHQYSYEVLSKLIDATEATANSLNVDINADLETARTNASSITNDPNETTHANKIKETSTTIVQALKKIQMEKYPDLDEDIAELQVSSMEIASSTQTLDQKTAVKDFFDQAEQVLTNMINR